MSVTLVVLALCRHTGGQVLPNWVICLCFLSSCACICYAICLGQSRMAGVVGAVDAATNGFVSATSLVNGVALGGMTFI